MLKEMNNNIIFNFMSLPNVKNITTIKKDRKSRFMIKIYYEDNLITLSYSDEKERDDDFKTLSNYIANYTDPDTDIDEEEKNI